MPTLDWVAVDLSEDANQAKSKISKLQKNWQTNATNKTSDGKNNYY